MKIAVVYNRESRKVINLFGVPNREGIGLKTIRRLADSLRKGGHQVASIEGDKDLIGKLENFMPRVVKGERPGMVFNVSYGIQGQARYTHVPSILEMVGVPYVGSGPLAHSLALDKVVTKMILRQNGLPTPDFAVLDTPDSPAPDLKYPLIVKPKNEAVSFGLRIVRSEKELREGAAVIFETFQQPVLVECYIPGKEINVGLLGNNPPETLPPVMIDFGKKGPAIYTLEDKRGTSGREVRHLCPAPVSEATAQRARELAVAAFTVLGCSDCARVDMRLDKRGNLFILEVNSLPSLGEDASYVNAAEHVGLDFTGLVNRLVEVASARYFGTPNPPDIHPRSRDPKEKIFSFLAERRDRLERRLKDWVLLSSRTSHPMGIQEATREVGKVMSHLALEPVPDLSDDPFAWTWETKRGLEGGTLLVLHLDVPMELSSPGMAFRQEPEWIYGEGAGSSRASLVCLEYALKALRSQRRLRNLPLGVLAYTDEGADARYSASTIKKAAARAKSVIVLRPGTAGDHVVHQRRGHRRYTVLFKDDPRRPGLSYRRRDIVCLVGEKICALHNLGSSKNLLSLSASEVHTRAFPMLLPHEVSVTVVMTYLDGAKADKAEEEMRGLLDTQGLRWELEMIADRPPMKERRGSVRLIKQLEEVARHWEIPLHRQSSVWPSVAGLVPARTPVLCGLGPVARDLSTPQEAVQRISLIQRTLLLAQFLGRNLK
jgi:D-alanine-D-alanine ligase